MNIGGITSYYPTVYGVKSNTVKGGIEKAPGWEDRFKTNGHDHYKVLSDEKMERAANQKSETKTEIVVKPDGSRVLVMTMSVRGMETTMSLEISKPTKAPNENSKQDTDNIMPVAENDTVLDETSVISNDD